MLHFAKLVEQLDLAAEFLCARSPIRGRLALILTDNAVELLLLDRCLDELDDSSRRLSSEPPDPPTKRVKGAVGGQFHDMVSCLAAAGALHEDEQTFLLQTHELRNEAYHRGELYEDTIHPIAWTHHQLACDLLPRMRRRSAFYRDGDPIPQVLRRHLPGYSGGSILGTRIAEDVRSSLSRARGSLSPSLGTSLSCSILRRLADIRAALRELARGEDAAESVAEVIADVQGTPGPRVPGVATTRTLARWEARARDIEGKHTPELPGRTLQRFLQLRNEIATFDDRVMQSLGELDEALNYLEDQFRDEQAEGADGPLSN